MALIFGLIRGWVVFRCRCSLVIYMG